MHKIRCLVPSGGAVVQIGKKHCIRKNNNGVFYLDALKHQKKTNRSSCLYPFISSKFAIDTMDGCFEWGQGLYTDMFWELCSSRCVVYSSYTGCPIADFNLPEKYCYVHVAGTFAVCWRDGPGHVCWLDFSVQNQEWKPLFYGTEIVSVAVSPPFCAAMQKSGDRVFLGSIFFPSSIKLYSITSDMDLVRPICKSRMLSPSTPACASHFLPTSHTSAIYVTPDSFVFCINQSQKNGPRFVFVKFSHIHSMIGACGDTPCRIQSINCVWPPELIKCNARFTTQTKILVFGSPWPIVLIHTPSSSSKQCQQFITLYTSAHLSVTCPCKLGEKIISACVSDEEGLFMALTESHNYVQFDTQTLQTMPI